MTGPAARRHTLLPVYLWIDIKALHTEQNIHQYKPGEMKRKCLFLSVHWRSNKHTHANKWTACSVKEWIEN